MPQQRILAIVVFPLPLSPAIVVIFAGYFSRIRLKSLTAQNSLFFLKILDCIG